MAFLYIKLMKISVIIIEVFLKFLKKNSCQAATDLGFSKKKKYIYIYIYIYFDFF